MITIDNEVVSVGTDVKCHLCGAAGMREFPAFREFRRITSDCRSWPAGGRLCCCPNCGTVQKIVDDDWNREVAELYAGYNIYDQAAGAEQAVFDQATGAAASRSARLLAALRGDCPDFCISKNGTVPFIALPGTGRMLDVGCGNERDVAGLQPCHARLVARRHGVGRQVPRRDRAHSGRTAALYLPAVGSAGRVRRDYDDPRPGAHSAPQAYFKQLATKLRPGGLLVVELPHHVANPFELLIADHCTHFASETAAALLQRAGFEVMQTAGDWVPKELTLVARARFGVESRSKERRKQSAPIAPCTLLPAPRSGHRRAAGLACRAFRRRASWPRRANSASSARRSPGRGSLPS